MAAEAQPPEVCYARSREGKETTSRRNRRYQGRNLVLSPQAFAVRRTSDAVRVCRFRRLPFGVGVVVWGEGRLVTVVEALRVPRLGGVDLVIGRRVGGGRPVRVVDAVRVSRLGSLDLGVAVGALHGGGMRSATCSQGKCDRGSERKAEFWEHRSPFLCAGSLSGMSVGRTSAQGDVLNRTGGPLKWTSAGNPGPRRCCPAAPAMGVVPAPARLDRQDPSLRSPRGAPSHTPRR